MPPDPTDPTSPQNPADPPADPPQDPASPAAPKGDPPPAPLGPSGKKALEAERQARQTAEKAAKDATEQNAQLQKQIQGIQSALGIKDPTDDPAEQLKAVQTENRFLKLERAVASAAAKANADPDLLWAHLRTYGNLDALDPTDATLATKLDELVKVTVAAKPNLLLTRSGGGSGGPRGGTIGGTKPGMSDWIREQAGRSS